MNPAYYRSTISVAFALFAIANSEAFATVWNVNPQGTGDFPTIQAAYDGASAGDVIVLAPGLYMDSNTRVLPDYGAGFPETVHAVAFAKAEVDLESSGGADGTFIDGESVRHGIVGLDLGTVAIRGVSIINATTSASGGGFSKWGGGLLAYRSQVTIENCAFIDCTSPAPPGGGGAGVFLAGGSGAVFRGNLFLRGYSSQLGGGIELYQQLNTIIENNTFVDNRALDTGGAILANQSSAFIDNNIFSGNEVGGVGGGVNCIFTSLTQGDCNVFWDNSASQHPHIGSECGLQIGQNENIVADPKFCNAPQDVFTISSQSPANPAHPSGCGLRGAFPVACGSVSVEEASWGEIKASYRSE